MHSEPDSSSAATRDRKLAALRRAVPQARYPHSDDYASLRPGFWVFYAPGPFADGRTALRFCAARTAAPREGRAWGAVSVTAARTWGCAASRPRAARWGAARAPERVPPPLVRAYRLSRNPSAVRHVASAASAS
ncbi:hypothetical protein [Streptomyces aureocirculatus]|uniref:hypothetical protein n=1 Tax=Streptomyces aureocirculatus TaxID=67275 RepID=UPI0012FEAC52|nr:hypothetical protein [Streptomyces aureocirculatus]